MAAPEAAPAPVAVEPQPSEVPAEEGISGLLQAHSNFVKYLYEPHGAVVDENVQKAEAASGLKREMFAYGAIGLVAIYLAFGGNAQFVCNFIGFLLGASASLKALRSDAPAIELLTYWFVFGLFTLADSGLNEVPVYFLLKSIVLLAVALPETQVARLINQYALQPVAALLG